MLHPATDHLSIWEIAHRWHGHDPNFTDPEALPLAVQDSLRNITKLQFCHELYACSPNGVVRKSLRTLPSFEEFIISEFPEADETTSDSPDGESPQTLNIKESTSALSDEERQDRYEEFSESWTRRHDEAVKDFPLCFKQRIFRKADLENVHVLRSDVIHLCELGQLPLPSFWFSHPEQEDHQQYLKTGDSSYSIFNRAARMKREEIDGFWSRLEAKQKHRLLCREIAFFLWNENPERTIADIIRDPAIQNIGSGKYYDSDKTVREWIKDLDPRPPEMKKGGRPASQ